MTLIDLRYRAIVALFTCGTVATVAMFAGCEKPSAPKPTAKAGDDDKPGDGGVTTDSAKPADGEATDPAKGEPTDGAETKTAAGDGNGATTTDGATEEHADPFQVPDGTVAELLAYIKGFQSLEPQVTTQEELVEYQRKMGRAMVTAADKILAQKPSAADAVEAVRIKLGVLEFLSESGDETAAAEREKFQEELATDDRPEVVQAVKQGKLLKTLSKWAQLDEDGRTALLEEIKQFFAAAPVDPDSLQIGMAIGNFLEGKNPAAAAEIYSTLSEKVADHTDPELAKYSSRFQGMARRLQLLGNEMEITGTLLEGTEIDWPAYRGKVVLVDFWATWCGPCIAELPNVIKNYEKYHDMGFDVVGISLDDNKEKVEAFIADRKIPWPILFSADEAHQGWEHPMAERYGISGIPAAILIDKEGKVVSLEARGPELGKLLGKLLGGDTDEPATEESSSEATEPKAETESETKAEQAGESK